MKRTPDDSAVMEPKALVIIGALVISSLAARLLLYSSTQFSGSVGTLPSESAIVATVSDMRLSLLGIRIDINRASFEELVHVPGIGEKTAGRILQFRKDAGFIVDLDELLVPGGPLDSKKLACLKRYFRQYPLSSWRRAELL